MLKQAERVRTKITDKNMKKLVIRFNYYAKRTIEANQVPDNMPHAHHSDDDWKVYRATKQGVSVGFRQAKALLLELAQQIEHEDE